MLSGNSFSKTQARAILPILVQRAMACQTITYGQLAEENDVFHLNLRWPLGCIRRTLDVLREQRNQDIPHIQGIVVNQNTGLPGDGVIFLLNRDLNPTEKERIVELELGRVFNYSRWLDVLEALGLPRFE